MLGAGGVGSRASRGPIGASGLSEGPDLFDPRGSSWSLLDEGGLVGALEVWPLHAG